MKGLPLAHLKAAEGGPPSSLPLLPPCTTHVLRAERGGERETGQLSSVLASSQLGSDTWGEMGPGMGQRKHLMQPEGTGDFREEVTANPRLEQKLVYDGPESGRETSEGAQASSTFRRGYGG